MAAQRSQQLVTRAGRQPLRPRPGCRYGNLRAPVQSGDANTDYNAAIALVQDKSRQDDAIVAFQNFIKKYPDSTYQPNANYWLGQLNYNKGKKMMPPIISPR